MRQVPNTNHSLDEHILRALNKIKKPGTAEEIADLLNCDLGPGDLGQPEPATTYRFAGDCQVPANTCKAERSWAGIMG